MIETWSDEAARVAALRRLELNDAPSDSGFEPILQIVRTICEAPAAAVVLVEENERILLDGEGLLGGVLSARDEAMCEAAIRQHEPLVVEDTHADLRFRGTALGAGEPFFRAYAGAQLKLSNGHQVGTLCAMDVEPRGFTPVQTTVLSQLARCVVREMELRQRAATDSMTGFLSRATFMDGLVRLIDSYTRGRAPAVLAILDLDHFKAVNDTFGHAVGDQVLQRLAEVCHRRLGDTALLGRLGGEEFGIALPRTSLDNAVHIMSGLLHAIAAIRIPEEPAVSVTASVGLAPMCSDFTETSSWCKFADAALYAAKHNGRNRLSVAQGPTMSQLVIDNSASVAALMELADAEMD